MKRGFTLVEIILSVALITVVGVGSIIGFITYKNYTKEKTLNEMDSEILTALRVYMETNEEIKSKVYEKKEGLAVSLQTLQNEGLIDFGNLDITDEDDYVVAFLTAENDCSDISTLKGWDFQDGKPLYICTNSSGGQNIFAVGQDAYNSSTISRTKQYLYWEESYATFNNIQYNIMSVDKDDSLTLLHTVDSSTGTAFGNVFDGLTQNDVGNESGFYLSFDNTSSCGVSMGGGHSVWFGDTEKNGEIFPTGREVHAFGRKCTSSGNYGVWTKWQNNGIMPITESSEPNINIIRIKKIKLKPCVKIVSGVGDRANPYELKNMC